MKVLCVLSSIQIKIRCLEFDTPSIVKPQTFDLS